MIKGITQLTNYFWSVSLQRKWETTSSQNGGSTTADEKCSKVEVVFGKNFYNFMLGKIWKQGQLQEMDHGPNYDGGPTLYEYMYTYIHTCTKLQIFLAQHGGKVNTIFKIQITSVWNGQETGHLFRCASISKPFFWLLVCKFWSGASLRLFYSFHDQTKLDLCL